MCIVKIKKVLNVRYYVNLTFTIPQTYHLYIYISIYCRYVYIYIKETSEKKMFFEGNVEENLTVLLKMFSFNINKK